MEWYHSLARKVNFVYSTFVFVYRKPTSQKLACVDVDILELSITQNTREPLPLGNASQMTTSRPVLESPQFLANRRGVTE